MKVRKSLFLLMVSISVLLCGCGVTKDTPITKMDDKYLQQEESTAPAGNKNSKEKTEEKETQASPKKKDKKQASETPKASPKGEKSKATSQKENTKTSESQERKSQKKKTKKTADKTKKTRKKATDSKKNVKNKNKETPMPASSAEKKQDKTETEDYCTISIDCKTILSNKKDLKSSKKQFVPASGIILKKTKVAFRQGDSVYDVLEKVCRQRKIHMEASYTPAYNTYYVEGIHQLYEFDCGDLSGWNYLVNGKSPNYGCSKYTVEKGDHIQWRYTCEAGKDM